MLLHTQILFVPSNETNEINVYSNKLVNNLHMISLYKLHNKLSCESRLSRSSCRACQASRARSVECVEPCCSTSSTQPKCMGSARRTCRVVLCRDVTSQVEFGLYLVLLYVVIVTLPNFTGCRSAGEYNINWLC